MRPTELTKGYCGGAGYIYLMSAEDTGGEGAGIAEGRDALDALFADRSVALWITGLKEGLDLCGCRKGTSIGWIIHGLPGRNSNRSSRAAISNEFPC